MSRRIGGNSVWAPKPTRRGLHQTAVDVIGSQIVDGTLREGEVLVEAILCDELGISRSGIREAIKVLAAKGLIESRPKVGTSIRSRSHWNMLDPDILWWWSCSGDLEGFTHAVFDMRRLIEPGAAALVAERGSDVDITRIGQAYDSMVTSLGDIDVSARADRDFHIAILDATGNGILRSLGSLTETALIASFKITSSLPHALANSLSLHEAVLRAIEARHPDKARRAMESLLVDAWELLNLAGQSRTGRADTLKVGT